MTAELQQTMLNHLNNIRIGLNSLYRASHTGVLRMDPSGTTEAYTSLGELEKLIRDFKVGEK